MLSMNFSTLVLFQIRVIFFHILLLISKNLLSLVKKNPFFWLLDENCIFFFYKRAICFRIIFIISIVWLSTRLVDDTINIKFCKIAILIQK